MTPRERAEALGWVREPDGMWAAVDRMVVWPSGGPSGGGSWWACPWWVRTGRIGVRFLNENEALEHALLLLDVWLS